MGQPHEYTLVTGACSGVGASVARRLAPASRLILQSSDSQRMGLVRSELPDSQSHLIWPDDLEESADVGLRLGALLNESGGVVHGFVHCAGAAPGLALDAADARSVYRLFQINVFSTTAIVRTLLKKAVNRGALRSIVFVSSIASRFGHREHGIYAAAKGAVDSLSRSLAVELAPHVRVNSILAGAIPGDAELSGAWPLTPEMTDGYLMGAGCPDDIASMAEYLMSNRARWITGQHFVVDGGKTAH